MKTTTSHLILLRTIGVFLIQRDGEPSKVEKHDPLEITSGFDAAIYGSFIQHANDKFSTLTGEDVLDLWETWSVNNIQDGKLTDSFSLPKPPEGDPFIEDYLVGDERFEAIMRGLNEVIRDPSYMPLGPSTVQMMYHGMKMCRTHAEIMYVGYSLGLHDADPGDSENLDGMERLSALDISKLKFGGAGI